MDNYDITSDEKEIATIVIMSSPIKQFLAFTHRFGSEINQIEVITTDERIYYIIEFKEQQGYILYTLTTYRDVLIQYDAGRVAFWKAHITPTFVKPIRPKKGDFLLE